MPTDAQRRPILFGSLVLDTHLIAIGYDFFISYTASDEKWAIWVDFILQEAGYSTIAQLYDFEVGSNFVQEIDQALAKSRCVAALLSSAYLESRWCSEEWVAGFRKKNLFPLKISKRAARFLRVRQSSGPLRSRGETTNSRANRETRRQITSPQSKASVPR